MSERALSQMLMEGTLKSKNQLSNVMSIGSQKIEPAVFVLNSALTEVRNHWRNWLTTLLQFLKFQQLETQHAHVRFNSGGVLTAW